MSERLNKTSICCIVFLDIVAYSQKADSEQLAYKNRFNQLLADAVKDIAQNDRIILDTGDGAAIAMMGSPEDAVFVSMTIRDGILQGNREHPEAPLFVRIGINLGPVRVVKDINGQMSIIGDGINVAQRIMSFAEPNHILVSRSYYEIVSRLSDELTQIFTYSGIKHDKHVREHEVYAIRQSGDAPVGDSAWAEDQPNAHSRAATGLSNGVKVAIFASLMLGLVAIGFGFSRVKTTAVEPVEAAGKPTQAAEKPTQATTVTSEREPKKAESHQNAFKKFFQRQTTTRPSKESSECTPAMRSLNQC